MEVEVDVEVVVEDDVEVVVEYGVEVLVLVSLEVEVELQHLTLQGTSFPADHEIMETSSSIRGTSAPS